MCVTAFIVVLSIGICLAKIKTDRLVEYFADILMQTKLMKKDSCLDRVVKIRIFTIKGRKWIVNTISDKQKILRWLSLSQDRVFLQ